MKTISKRKRGLKPKPRPTPTLEQISMLPKNASFIPLSNGEFAIVDSDMADELGKYLWQIHANYYAGRWEMINGVEIKTMMHRQIMNAPKGYLVDHINGNKLDNRKCNLRLATRAQNAWNSKIRVKNQSGLKGVTQIGSSLWIAQIKANGRNFYLGQFKSPNEAHEAYKMAAAKHHGQFANFGSYGKEMYASI